ncbi:MAG: hypothetical protein J6J53_03930, partial [Muribaculaceae bacterium]|nr:hypothetical protein [Muribaculaceae bacterium]
MVKKFFLSFLGSMAAIWLTFLLLVILIISGIAVSISSMSNGVKSVATAEVKKGSVLVIDLAGAINERKITPSITDALQGSIKGGLNLSETVAAIYRAAHDARISGIYIKCEG